MNGCEFTVIVKCLLDQVAETKTQPVIALRLLSFMGIAKQSSHNCFAKIVFANHGTK